MGESLWRQIDLWQNNCCFVQRLGLWVSKTAVVLQQHWAVLRKWKVRVTIYWKKNSKDSIKRDVSTPQSTGNEASQNPRTCQPHVNLFSKNTHHSFSVGPWSTWSHRTRHQCSCALQPSTLLPCAAAPRDKVAKGRTVRQLACWCYVYLMH